TASTYAACVSAHQCSTDDLRCNPGSPAATFAAPGRENYPINCVSFDQASAYCSAQGKRLPTADEWEWAARGGAGAHSFAWGNGPPSDQVCWSGTTKRDGPCPVGSFPSGDAPGGLHDLSGNVWEWTASA